MADSTHVSNDDVLSALDENNTEQATDDAAASDGWRDAEDLGTDDAHAAWAEAGREVLLETARRYRGTVSHKDLAAHVQERSRVRTARRSHYWLGDVLGRVAAECVRRDEPLLPSLAVKADGTMAEGYADAVADAHGQAPEDPDAHAAIERLACHRHFDARDLPADGGIAALTPLLEKRRAREKKVRLEERPVPICPSCSMQIPVTGICDNCG